MSTAPKAAINGGAIEVQQKKGQQAALDSKIVDMLFADVNGADTSISPELRECMKMIIKCASTLRIEGDVGGYKFYRDDVRLFVERMGEIKNTMIPFIEGVITNRISAEKSDDRAKAEFMYRFALLRILRSIGPKLPRDARMYNGIFFGFVRKEGDSFDRGIPKAAADHIDSVDSPEIKLIRARLQELLDTKSGQIFPLRRLDSDFPSWNVADA